MLPPILKTITVAIPPARAFDIFAKETRSWWPLDKHSVSAMSGNVAKSVDIEPHVGGSVTETKDDGSTTLWGTVTGWKPGQEFAMNWHIGNPPEQATKLKVRFEAEGKGTRVTLEHSGWEALGDKAADNRAGYDGGWVNVFETAFAKGCAKVAA